MIKRLPAMLWGVAAVAAAITPLLGPSGYWMRLLSTVFMAVALAQAMNLMVGYAGYPALGNLAFFGTGGYVTVIVMNRLEWPFAVALLLAALVAALYAGLLGLPILRLRGAYFGIATIGINEVTRELVYNLTDLTGGGQGVTLPFFPGDIAQQQAFFYYLMLGLAALATAVVWWLSRTRLGYALRALKADEDGARAMGIETTLAKTATWAISAAITGAVGSAYAYWLSFLEPAPVFDITLSVKYYIIAILGGAGTIAGPIAGALVFELLAELVWSNFLSLHMLVLGVLVVLLALFMPKGIMGFIQARRKGPAKGVGV